MIRFVERMVEGVRNHGEKRREWATAAERWNWEIARIKTFQGSKEEFEKLTGGNYEYITLPAKNKFITGAIDRKLKLDPYDFIIEPRGSIFAQAVRLGADILVQYKPHIDGWGVSDRGTGVPIRQVTKDNSQREKPNLPLINEIGFPLYVDTDGTYF